MPTDEWFKENPKISAYISPNLNEKLSEWMKNRGIKKVSQALTTILESYLGVNQDSPNIEGSENNRLRIVEQKLESLSQEVRSLTERNEKKNQRVVQTELILETELILVEPLEEALPKDEEITLIDTEQPIEIIEEVQKDKPNEIIYDFQDPIETTNTTMTIKEVSALIGWTDDKVRSRHKRNQKIEEKERKFIPIREGNRPFWKVEKVENKHLDF